MKMLLAHFKTSTLMNICSTHSGLVTIVGYITKTDPITCREAKNAVSHANCNGSPHKRPTPCQAKLSHLSTHFVFKTYHCNNCTIPCPDRYTRKLIFAASGNDKQAGRGVACGEK